MYGFALNDSLQNEAPKTVFGSNSYYKSLFPSHLNCKGFFSESSAVKLLKQKTHTHTKQKEGDKEQFGGVML